MRGLRDATVWNMQQRFESQASTGTRYQIHMISGPRSALNTTPFLSAMVHL